MVIFFSATFFKIPEVTDEILCMFYLRKKGQLINTNLAYEKICIETKSNLSFFKQLL